MRCKVQLEPISDCHGCVPPSETALRSLTNENVGPLGERHGLRHVVHAAHQDDRLEANGGTERIKRVADLKGKLTTGRVVWAVSA